ncbi:MAG: plasmid mobilization protein [Roseimicrobium sp.]
MSVLTVRISEKEKAALAVRAKAEGTTTGALVRRMIQEKPFTTSADLLAEIQTLMGDKRLAIKQPS